jgi:uncharacterized membrane protein YkoI
MKVHPTRSFVHLVAALLLASAVVASVSPAAADPEDSRRRGQRDARSRDYDRSEERDRRGGSLGADWSAHQDDARRGVREGRLVPLSQILAEIRRRSPGRQLDAGLESDRGRPVYRVRWAAVDGRRIDYIVDAESGRILGEDAR